MASAYISVLVYRKGEKKEVMIRNDFRYNETRGNGNAD